MSIIKVAKFTKAICKVLLKLSQADLEKIDEQYELYKPLLLCEFKIYNNNYINESSIKFLNDSKNDDLTKKKMH